MPNRGGKFLRNNQTALKDQNQSDKLYLIYSKSQIFDFNSTPQSAPDLPRAHICHPQMLKLIKIRAYCSTQTPAHGDLRLLDA